MVSVVSFLLYPYVLHRLGDAASGVWVLIWAVVGYFNLLDLGISAAIVKLVAENVDTGVSQRRANDAIIFNGVFLFTILGAITIVLGLPGLELLDRVFHVPSALLHDAKLAYTIVLVTVGIVFPGAILSAVLIGSQDYRTQNILLSLQQLLTALLIVFVLKTGHGIVGMAIASMVSALALFGARIILVKRKHTFRPFDFRLLDRQLIARILAFSKWVLLLNVAVQIVFQTDNLVIGAFSTVTAITFYQVALKPNNFLRSLGGQVNAVIMPTAAALEATHNRARLQRLLCESTRVSAVTLLPAMIVFAAWGKDFIRCWVGPQYLSSYPTLLILGSGVFATLVQGTSGNIILSLSKHKLLSIVACLEAVVNLTLSIILIHTVGILGVALGTTIPTMLVAYGVSIPYAARLTGVSLWKLYKKILVPVAVACIFTAIAALINQHFVFVSLGQLAVASGVIFILFFAVNILLDPAERHIYLEILEKIFGGRLLTSKIPAELDANRVD